MSAQGPLLPGLAPWLVEQPQVERVYYPGLPNHPGHDVAKRQMRDFGGMISVRLKGGTEAARRPGSQVHDEILFDKEGGFQRGSNSAGGLEGGVTNGQPVVVRAAMKPISTLRKPLRSVDLDTRESVEAVVERSDVCAVPAAGVVGEAMMAIVLVEAFLEKFGGDSVEEIRRNHQGYLEYLKGW